MRSLLLSHQSKMTDNPPLDLARRYVEQTSRNIFLSGKAGTGKTTFLKSLNGTLDKRYVVLAPTGIAALNAEGQTIHSFLQLSFDPYVPGMRLERKQFRKAKLDLIRSLDLIIIDEISMVRADVLDQIDLVLRRIRPRYKMLPFGGVQMLLIGDLSQLPPVATNAEWELLSQFYKTPYFFSSQAWNESNFHSINLEHIYRQTDREFIELLNCVRENRITSQVCAKLNARYEKDILEKENEGYVILCTHNYQAKQINAKRLGELESESHFYECEISGDFDAKSYPTDEVLELKEGAQVMFLKNDYSQPAQSRRYFNGSIGHVVHLSDTKVVVRLKNSDTEIEVEPYVWEKYRYTMDKKTKEIEKELVGSFKQYPLRLAWAITVHKSQGLTFDKAVIHADKSFTHGQFYVALSRCRNLEGLVLASPFSSEAVITDVKVSDFSQSQMENLASESTFQNDRFEFYFRCLEEAFDYEVLNTRLLALGNWELVLKASCDKEVFEAYRILIQAIKEDVIAVSRKFLRQLRQLYHYPERIKVRCAKAKAYFSEKMPLFFALLNAWDAADWEEEGEKEGLEDEILQTGMEIEMKCRLLDCLEGEDFSVKDFLSIKNKAAAEGEKICWQHYKDFVRKTEKQNGKAADQTPEKSDETAEPASQSPQSEGETPKKTLGELELDDLYQALKTWRRQKAAEEKLPAYCILSQNALVGIVNTRPKTLDDLLAVKGVGNKILEKYGEELLTLISEH